MNSRDTLTNLLLDCAETAASPRETAEYLIERGVRPPALVITDPAALPGEWIIRDTRGFYPCKADVFADTYEPSEESL